MLNKKETALVLIIAFIFAISLSFLKGIDVFLSFLIISLLVLIINIFAKKIAGFYLDSEVEIDVWKMKRYGFKPGSHFKRGLPAGALFPLLSSVLTFGNFVWLASLIFEVKPKIYRAAKRHTLYKFSEMTEEHIGLIATAGITANILFAILGYLIGFSDFAKLNIYFATFNLIPLSNLDGNKIFFGNIVTWSTLSIIALIGLGASLFLV